ncbi:hypothetical protein BGZ65_008539, partial [Modicella reniformis]
MNGTPSCTPLTSTSTTLMQLQRLNLRGSFIYHEGVLIPLLRRSPLLEHVDIARYYHMAVGEGIIQALIKHCPNLQSFHDLESWNVNTISPKTVGTLLEGYRNGLRSLKSKYTYDFSIFHLGLWDQGALTRSLMEYSACTIEVLVLKGNMRLYKLRRECPNLKVVRIESGEIYPVDLIHESSWKATISE